jgi:hypothetical protein
MQSVASRSVAARPLSHSGAATKTRQQRAVVAAARPSNDVVASGSVPVSLGRQLQQAAMSVAAGAVIAAAPPAMARLEGVNNPQMLPPGAPVEVLDVAGAWDPSCKKTPEPSVPPCKIIQKLNPKQLCP